MLVSAGEIVPPIRPTSADSRVLAGAPLDLDGAVFASLEVTQTLVSDVHGRLRLHEEPRISLLRGGLRLL